VADRVVLDASVVLALLRHDRDSPSAATAAMARDALRAWVEAGVGLAVVPGFWTEVLDSLAGGGPAEAAALAEALHALDGLDLVTVDLELPGFLLVADVMERHGLDAGRAAPVVLADLLDAPLATLDPATARAAGPGRAAIRANAADAPVGAAGAEAAWRTGSLPDYHGLGTFLGELRRRATVG
jgi:hypothetical protein